MRELFPVAKIQCASCILEQIQCLSMAEEQSQISIQDLQSGFSNWIAKRKQTVHTLRVFADELMEHHKNVCVANVAGSSFSIAGFAAVATGFGLSFVTFGAPVLLLGVGAVFGAAGGLVNVGSSAIEAYLQKRTLDTVQKIIEEDREATIVFQKFLKEAKQQSKPILDGIRMGCKGAVIFQACGKTGYKIGVRVGAQAVGEGGEALFRGLKMAGKIVHVGGFVVNAALLPLDIYTLVKNAVEIDALNKGKKDNEPEVVKKLRKVADELEMELRSNEDNFA